MKHCTHCAMTKPLSDFYSHQRLNKTTGVIGLYYFPYCRLCNSQKKRNKDHTRDGIANTLYVSQCLHSKKRGYAAPNYSVEELRSWLLANPVFETLFIAWENSGFNCDKKPSCNRLDDYAGYSLANIELLTWQQNREAWARDCLSGKNRKISRPVKQLNLTGEFINEFFSIQDASRKLDIPHANIVKNCTGKRASAGGYRWQYTDPLSAPKHTGFVGRS